MRLEDRARRLRSGVVEDGVAPTEVSHPKGLLKDSGMEGAGCVAIVLLAGLLIALVVFALEIVIAIAAALIVAVARLVFGHWHCEVTSPDGRRELHRVDSLREARELRDELVESIESGTRTLTA